MCANYAKSIGIEISDDQKERIIAQAKEAELTPDPARRLMRLSVILRREVIRLPLKMTLLIKNLYFLDRMAKKAGMTGITEAAKAGPTQGLHPMAKAEPTRIDDRYP